MKKFRRDKTYTRDHPRAQSESASARAALKAPVARCTGPRAAVVEVSSMVAAMVAVTAPVAVVTAPVATARTLID
jgi:hypothetical protein